MMITYTSRELQDPNDDCIIYGVGTTKFAGFCLAACNASTKAEVASEWPAAV